MCRVYIDDGDNDRRHRTAHAQREPDADDAGRAMAAAPFLCRRLARLKSRRLGMDVPVALGIAASASRAWTRRCTGSGRVYRLGNDVRFLLLGARYLELGARARAARRRSASRGRRLRSPSATVVIPVRVVKPARGRGRAASRAITSWSGPVRHTPPMAASWTAKAQRRIAADGGSRVRCRKGWATRDRGRRGQSACAADGARGTRRRAKPARIDRAAEDRAQTEKPRIARIADTRSPVVRRCVARRDRGRRRRVAADRPGRSALDRDRHPRRYVSVRAVARHSRRTDRGNGRTTRVRRARHSRARARNARAGHAFRLRQDRARLPMDALS